MILDLSRYRAAKPAIKSFLDSKDPSVRFDCIGEAAVVTYCPIIAVAHYYGELYGVTPRLLEFISAVMSFYRIEKVVGAEHKYEEEEV